MYYPLIFTLSFLSASVSALSGADLYGRSLPQFPGTRAHVYTERQQQNTACNTTLGAGQCMSTNFCNGFTIAGHCPGGSSNQCCIQKSCTTSQGSGTCLNKSKGCSGGAFVANGCPGDTSVACCVKGAKSSMSKSSSPTSTSAPSSSASSTTPANPNDPHPISQQALALIESEEGFRPNYYTINGDKTIGYGHDCTQRKDCANIKAPLSQPQGETLLKTDLVEYENCVCKLPNAANLNANQYGALVSFTYNAGCGGVSSSFKSYMSSSNFAGICNALPSTRNNGGQLTSRRQREAALCKQASSAKSGC